MDKKGVKVKHEGYYDQMVGAVNGELLLDKRRQFRSFICQGSIQKYQLLPGDLPDVLMGLAPVMSAYGTQLARPFNGCGAYSDVGVCQFITEERGWRVQFSGGLEVATVKNLYLYVGHPIGRFVADTWFKKQEFFDAEILKLETPEFIRQILVLTGRCQETGAELTELDRRYAGP